ncbi:MAG: methyltransferase domain-containing protein [Candidatus Lokiarchaeota archaeon]|nr:methyltransferase domain-containing protein [Candidatus Lokiarchaeota archaeon]
MEILFEIFRDLPRQGPGDTKFTLKAFNAIKNKLNRPIILDVGCGSGMQTIDILDKINGKIIALDFHKPYLLKLQSKIIDKYSQFKIDIINSSMHLFNFKKAVFDLIWSEGSIFIYGFEAGLRDWKQFLKKKGFFVISELSLFKKPPDELKEFFNSEYPPIKLNKENLDIINKYGYDIIENFSISDTAWWNNYYTPLEKRLGYLREKYESNKNYLDMIKSVQHEIEIFRRFSEYYGYYFYVLQKT